MFRDWLGGAAFVVAGFALGFFRSRSAQHASPGEAVGIGLGVAAVFLVLFVVGLLIDRERHDR